MSSARLSLGLLVTPAMLALGCNASPWAANQSPGPITPIVQSAPPAPSPAAAPVDTQGMHQVLAEIRQAGALDQATQDKLIEDLQQADPALWPLLVQQFRAQMAYRQRAQQQSGEPAAAEQAFAAPPPLGPGSAEVAATPANVLPGGVVAGPSGSIAPPKALPAEPSPIERSKADLALTSLAGGGAPGQTPASEPNQAGASDVVQVSYLNAEHASAGSPLSGESWKNHLSAAIQAREAELRQAGGDDELAQAQLRMLYLLAGRRDDALRPIAGAPPATQNFLASQLFGMGAWMDAERTADPSRRAAEAKRHLGEALHHLAENCPLVVRNLAFCREIHSFGCVKQFERYEFSPGQSVLLYAEVENLSGESTPRGVHTALRSSYQIFDSRGQRVADQEFTMTEEYCRNSRRDYFTGYELRLPDRIYPGKHTLQLTVEDLKSQKIGQSTIEFSVTKAER